MELHPSELYPCEPEGWKKLPSSLRYIFGWISIILYTLGFLVVPISSILLLPWIWRNHATFATSIIGAMVVSLLLPPREWLAARTIGQLWYEIFQFSCNLSPEQRKAIIKKGHERRCIIAMHPHGIIPIHAVLWSAYCDQYLSDGDDKLYGFAAAADAVFYIPFLRNFMYWLCCGSASASTIKKGLTTVHF